MVYEAAAAVALRDQSQPHGEEKSGGNGGARNHGRQPQQQVVRKKKVTTVWCGVLRIFRRVFPVSAGAPGSGKNKN
ncbi:hypothetical protein PR202_ga30579 [Eleusine coracana subsp. coracana]|uniref:Uncharacterized protein n=1 Tax=Eleusine coracana subsp. coracana TaxID=191504 RepID=A0AAV5DQY9_ELECO|nr:hypothetical protein PR202_ga30579 [Eleusine coracana subsp. coracana]